ncbi:MAG: SpoIIE family protein phosphatase [Proteobacteria bacterium]|nr:SpoIIE family protein phosphatase [Pseudomonadota bacterium]
MADKILIVDDSEDLRKLLLLILKRAGYEVMEASNGSDGIKKADTFAPDLILLDIVMPGIDGYEVCVKFKQAEQTMDIPIIFLSAKTDTADKIKGLEMGGADYITKPFDKGEVVARVQNQLKIRHLTHELIDKNRELTVKQKRLDEDLEAAGGIQRSLLPQKIPHIEGLDVAWKFLPSYLIGGDIFNIIQLDENNIAFYMIDVSGHGVPSALVTVSLSQILQPNIGNITKRKYDRPPGYKIASPKEVMQALDNEYPLERFDKYFTMTYLIINILDNTVFYSNAAHPAPVLLRHNGNMEFLDKGGTIIGMGGIMPFEEEQKMLKERDKIILYTDGVVEFQNKNGEFYGEERFYSLLETIKNETVDNMLNKVIASINNFGEGIIEFQDDITLVGIEYKKEG